MLNMARRFLLADEMKMNHQLTLVVKREMLDSLELVMDQQLYHILRYCH